MVLVEIMVVMVVIVVLSIIQRQRVMMVKWIIQQVDTELVEVMDML